MTMVRPPDCTRTVVPPHWTYSHGITTILYVWPWYDHYHCTCDHVWPLYCTYDHGTATITVHVTMVWPLYCTYDHGMTTILYISPWYDHYTRHITTLWPWTCYQKGLVTLNPQSSLSASSTTASRNLKEYLTWNLACFFPYKGRSSFLFTELEL